MTRRGDISGFRAKSRFIDFGKFFQLENIREGPFYGQGMVNGTVVSRMCRECTPLARRMVKRGIIDIVPLTYREQLRMFETATRGEERRRSGWKLSFEMMSTGRIKERHSEEYETGLLLEEIAQEDGGCRFNLALLQTLILKSIDHKIALFLNIDPLQRLTRELPLVLISGYVYLERYIKALKTKFVSYASLIKVFLACCLIGAKFMFDSHYPSTTLVSELGFVRGEMNYIEGAILSAIKYKLEIYNSDIKRVILEEGMYFWNKEVFESRFCRAMDKAGIMELSRS
jgi:hypothetical protein